MSINVLLNNFSKSLSKIMTKIEGLRNEMRSKFEGVDTKIMTEISIKIPWKNAYLS